MILLRLVSSRKESGGGLDPDAQAFITAAGITNPTQQSAINQLVLDLKSYSLWTKMTAIYPIVGGTSSSHSYNLKNTAAFQITWGGSPLTHSSTGVTNNAQGYGGTGVVPSSHLLQDDVHVSHYSRTLSPFSNNFDMLVSDSSYVSALGMAIYYSGNNLFSVNSTPWGTGASATFYGLFTATRQNNTTGTLYQNSSSIATTGVSVALPPSQIPLCAFNVGGSIAYPSGIKEYAWFSIGSGLNATDVGNLYTAVQAFQTTLGRQV